MRNYLDPRLGKKKIKNMKKENTVKEREREGVGNSIMSKHVMMALRLWTCAKSLFPFVAAVFILLCGKLSFSTCESQAKFSRARKIK